ncbi:MAG: type I 3-dehydroquinate dehydratase [Clostridiales bacterium]|nr:type I 3-dehydroquinate dehydratase [Clostridiales bacterium]
MKSVTVRDVVIGEGRPKICVPIVGRTLDEILREAGKITEFPADVVEWRADWYAEALEENPDAETDSFEHMLKRMEETALRLRQILGERPLLFTFRTKAEGGERTLTPAQYEQLNEMIAASGAVDLIDVELFTAGSHMKEFMEVLHQYPVKVVASSHDFAATPSKDEMVGRMCRMQECGADLVKMAVMPRCRQDVLTLLSAVVEMNENHAETPVIAMSMSAMGVASRLVGECFGSALTFGAAGQASAPGQIGVENLKIVLDIIHQGVEGK